MAKDLITKCLWQGSGGQGEKEKKMTFITNLEVQRFGIKWNGLSVT